MLLRRFLIFEDISTIGNKSRHGGQRRRLLKAKGMHGIGAKAGDTEAQQIHDALDAILSTLEDTHINLREAFESFDRSANGSISIAEFASLIKTLGGLGKSIKKQMERASYKWSTVDSIFVSPPSTVDLVFMHCNWSTVNLVFIPSSFHQTCFIVICSRLLF